MTTTTKKQPVELTVNCTAKTVWVRSEGQPPRLCQKASVLWVYDTTGNVESHDPLDRAGGPYRITDFVPSEGDKWFLFAVADCYFPCRDLVRGSSWEDAYETYIDWAATNRHIAIDDADLTDYKVDTDECTCNYTSNGQPVDTDNVVGDEMTLDRIDA